VSASTRTLRAAGAALTLALSGCGAIQGVQSRLPPREPQPGPEAGEWAVLRDATTRREKLYDGFVHRADVTVTWLSAPVREAATRRLADWQAWGPEDLERALAADRVEAAKGEEFLVSLYTANPRHNDLDAKETVWRLEIDDGTTRSAATAVTAVRADASIKQLFPYVGPFDQVYRVKVPWTGAPLAGRPFTFRLASALGRLDLDYGSSGKQAERPHVAP
jgi:hypothetical protein